MLFFSLFLFAAENLVQKDIGVLNFSSPDSLASSTSASPVRRPRYTAYLQQKPPALSLVANSANSEEQAKKLLKDVGKADNFSALTDFSSTDADIEIEGHGKFKIISSSAAVGCFDGFYRLRAEYGENTMYKLVVQNVRTLGILKSFMTELLKAYIGRDSLFTGAPKVDVPALVLETPNSGGSSPDRSTNSAAQTGMQTVRREDQLDRTGESVPSGVLVAEEKKRRKFSWTLPLDVSGTVSSLLTHTSRAQSLSGEAVDDGKKGGPPGENKDGEQSVAPLLAALSSRQIEEAGDSQQGGPDEHKDGKQSVPLVVAVSSSQEAGGKSDRKWFGAYTIAVVVAVPAISFALWKFFSKKKSNVV